MQVLRRAVSALLRRTPWVFSRLLYLGLVLQVVHLLFGSAIWIRRVVGVYSIAFFDVIGSSLGFGAFLMILGWGLTRRKRLAWWVTVLLLGLQAVVNLLLIVSLLIVENVRGDRRVLAIAVVSLVTSTLMLVWLIAARKQFGARSPRGNWLKALLVLVIGFTVTAGIGALLVMVVPADPGRRGPVPRLEWLWHRLLHDSAGPTLAMPRWVAALLGFLQAVSLLAAFWALLRSQMNAVAHNPGDEPLVRALVAESPDDSLAYFATRRDKSWCFADDSRAAIAYRVVLGCCLASGDPVGPRQEWPSAIRAWQQMAHDYGWTPAVIGASETGAEAYARHADLRIVKLGDEAVLEPRNFNLDSHELRPVRQAVERMRRLGYTVRIRRHDAIDPVEMERLIELADRWRDTEEERGFSMALGRLGDPLDGGCLMVEALFADDEQRAGTEVAGLLSFVPWGPDGYSLDVMRRNPEADNGVTELMVAELMASGVRRVSLNFAVFRSAFERGAQIGAGPLIRLWRRLLLFASRWWQLESLYRSNVKYRPDWLPRYLGYDPESGDVALVGAASGVAEGFVDLPAWLVGKPTLAPAPTLAEVEAVLPVPTTPPDTRPEQVRIRAGKRERLLAGGADPYPPDFQPTATCADATGECSVAGRVLRIRDHGGVIFCELRDWSGDLQVLLSADRVADLQHFGRDVDLGDHVGFHGVAGESRTGTRSLLADGWRLTAKSLRPLPDKRGGLSDPEARVRQRYLDLTINRSAAARLRTRSEAISEVRRILLDRGFLEVETPILQAIHGGANARPFRTHINAYDLDLYLRIAPELYLKRLLVGGVDRVFELGRNFRNEGADATHNPEFTMLEAYQAYADYTTMRHLTKDLITGAVTAGTGGTTLLGRDHTGTVQEVDLAGDWPVVTVNDAISTACGEPVTADTDREALVALARRLDIPIDARWTRGNVLLELYEHLVEDRTVAPTFYTDFPAEVSPLTRQHRTDDRLAERWDLVAFGAEIGTAYSELVDPVLQRQRLTEQSLQAAGGDPEAMELDEDFLVALEHGMPPAGGLGMGIDRLVMMITNTSIRDAITFPLVRPRRAGRG
ncbi:bifunctional lysylphosphatidylglycerol synthetase/lysine--tRNA ligase LysX [Enemella evansiae]|uniref:bifunctional lysylphosphatidylglycerol synthetase/lysine--tRNA ligase LysX n=1 Tax=Enemella evansiae TaxID=2016499 RepID=UPI00106070C0|nr:bifunctional lysylphosphatidylglycerol synthetase/lysine--tRNA ligase LysX [Enemella evansiae]TDO87962.1 lysyl-tRNA synthetase class II [Enemella evansiae]